MRLSTRFLVLLVLVPLLALGWVQPAFAALGIDTVIPATLVNTSAVTLTLTGTDFDSTAVVLLDGFGALATTFLNSQTLTAMVPAGTPAGDYTVRVTTSAPASQTWSGTLHVQAPAPTAAPTQPAFGRPQIIINSYKSNVSTVQAGDEFRLKFTFGNAGNVTALNAQAAFTSADLIPTRTGGVAVIGSIPPGASGEAGQTFMAVDSLSGKSVVVVDVTLTYYDDKGTTYSDKFTVSVPASGGYSGVAYPTSTPTSVNSAQLVITSYATTVDPLQPGEQFELGMTVQNMGNTDAKRVTMIVGGGSSGSSGETPVAGGTSGGSGEFTNFAPVGSSNIQSLGDLSAGGALQVRQSLIVNVSTDPGAYPMKITFSYVNSKGEVINDDQVITLLVYSLPKLDISFYRDPGTMFTGQPNMLPIQVANLGKRTAVLGNMVVETTNGMIEVPSTLVGTLD
ncbi:MAG TPA: IPT/TIG domain-containing protein, partial [Anaerolineales bacterium]